MAKVQHFVFISVFERNHHSSLFQIKPLENYESGIINDPKIIDVQLNHVVTIVGYGRDENCGKDFWLLKNSWGPKRGENGYFRVERNNPDIQIGQWVLQPTCEST